MLESAVEEIHRRWAEEAEARLNDWRRRAAYARLDGLVPELEEYCLDESEELPQALYQEVVDALSASDERLAKRARALRAPARLLDCVFDAQEIELRKLGAGPLDGDEDDEPS